MNTTPSWPRRSQPYAAVSTAQALRFAADVDVAVDITGAAYERTVRLVGDLASPGGHLAAGIYLATARQREAARLLRHRPTSVAMLTTVIYNTALWPMQVGDWRLHPPGLMWWEAGKRRQQTRSGSDRCIHNDLAAVRGMLAPIRAALPDPDSDPPANWRARRHQRAAQCLADADTLLVLAGRYLDQDEYHR